MGIKDSILKDVLLNKGCSIGKYLAEMQHSEKDGKVSVYYITPLVTLSKKKLLIISRLVKGNWYESIRIINGIISDISIKYDLKKDDYTIILHAYFDVIALEQFYEVDTGNGNSLNRLPFTEFEKLLI